MHPCWIELCFSGKNSKFFTKYTLECCFLSHTHSPTNVCICVAARHVHGQKLIQMSECGLNWLFLVHRFMSKPLIKASFTKCQPESLSRLWPPRLRPDAADSSFWSASAHHIPLSGLSLPVVVKHLCTHVSICISPLAIKSFRLLRAEAEATPTCKWLQPVVLLLDYNANTVASVLYNYIPLPAVSAVWTYSLQKWFQIVATVASRFIYSVGVNCC